MSYKRLSPNKLLGYITDVLLFTLEEIQERIPENGENDFLCGEMTMIVDCLELIHKHWKRARKFGLNFEIEKKFPL